MPAPATFKIGPNGFLVHEPSPRYAPSSPYSNMGQTLPIRMGQSGTAKQMVYSCVSDEPGDTLTVSLSRYDNPDAGEDPNGEFVDVALKCVLGYGSGNYSENAEIDWLNGTVFTIPVGSVQVYCDYPKWSDTQADCRQLVSVAVGVNVARQGGMGELPITRLTSRLIGEGEGGRIVPGDSIRVAVPNRATSVSLLVEDPTLYGSFPLSFKRSNHADARVEYVYRPMGAEQLPLAAGVRAVTVTNGAATDQRLTLLWGIAL